MTARTSLTHPLQIAEVTAPATKGVIGITFCPGKKQNNAMSGAWDRDLGLDLDAIKAWGAAIVITLIEPHEIRALKVENIKAETIRRGMEWLHMPITDVSVPDHRFEEVWKEKAPRLVTAIREGHHVLFHCKGGLGRAGTVAALMLVELGMEPNQAIRAVRAARKGAIETEEQERFVRLHNVSTVAEETILEVGAEGGSISLVGRRQNARWEFRLKASEMALCNDSGLTAPPSAWVPDWNSALAQLDRYPWPALHPLAVHPEFRGLVGEALVSSTSRHGGNCSHWHHLLIDKTA